MCLLAPILGHRALIRGGPISGGHVNWLEELWSPEQIANRLRLEHRGDPMSWVSHETIYQSLFVQGRGALKRELVKCLRTGRAERRPRRRSSAERRGQSPDKVMISERPAEVVDRAVPGHWEGDLIVGAGHRPAIGTLVERTSRYVLLLHLPGGGTAEAVNAAMAEAIGRLPAELSRSVTWDQGTEMSKHLDFTIATGIPVYFCDPHSPWQRPSNENANGLLRQVFPRCRPEHLQPCRSGRCRAQAERPPPQDPQLAHDE